MDPSTALGMELWELAAVCNLDLVETHQDRRLRELADVRADQYEAEYWQGAEGAARMEAIKRRAGRRKDRRRR